MAVAEISREQVLAFRVAVQQLHRVDGELEDTAILDLGVQDTGPDGALWALAVRGVEVRGGGADLAEGSGPGGPGAVLTTLWTLRGAPHRYRRADLPSVAAAVAPFSEADAARRLGSSVAKPLAAAGIGCLQALEVTARELAELVTGPRVKGDVSGAVTQRLPEPCLRWCPACRATHPHEQLFRLGATRAGLELIPGTSPPVLRPAVPGSGRRPPAGGFEPAEQPLPRHDVVRAALHLLGPASPKLVAGFLDAAVKDVEARWPRDVVEVRLGGELRCVLRDDVATLEAAGRSGRAGTRAGGAAAGADPVRLLGPYDLYLQVKDRDLLVPDRARTTVLWPALGRPGAVLRGGEVIGFWRPRASGRKLTVSVRTWARPTRRDVAAVEAEALRLAGFRGLTLAGCEVERNS